MSLRLLAVYITLPVLIFFTFKNAFWGLMTLAGYYYIRPDIWGWQSIRPAYIMTAATLAALLIRRNHDFSRRVYGPVFAFGLMACWMLLNSRNAVVSREIAWEYSIRLAKLVVLFYLVSNIANSERRIQIILCTLVFGLLWLSKSVFVQYIIEARPRVDPLGGSGGGGNEMATDLCMTLPFLIYGYFYGKKKIKFVSTVLISVWLFDLVAIASRGGFIGLILVITLFSIKSKYRGKMAILVLCSLIFFIFISPDFFWKRMETIINYQKDKSAMSRLVLWKIAWKMHKDHPVFGIGTKNFQSLSVHYDSTGTLPEKGLVAHNSYVELLAENGYPAVVFYLLGIFWVISQLRKCRKLLDEEDHESLINLSHVLEIGLIVFLWRGVTGTNYFGDVLYWFLGLGVGLYQYVLSIVAYGVSKKGRV